MSINHGSNTILIQTQTTHYKPLDDSMAFCHWHHEYEFAVLLEGCFDIYINGVLIELRTGDGYFLNSDVLHMGRLSGKTDVTMFSCKLPAAFLFPDPNSELSIKYLSPILTARTKGFKFSKEDAYGKELIAALLRLYMLEPSAFGYELECNEIVNRLWLTTLRAIESEGNNASFSGNQRTTDRMKAILSYIEEHIQQKTTIDDIARYVGISRGECFRCFKSFTGKPIVGYINETRLRKAAGLLRESELDIASISAECGFENPSYFGKLFRESYAMTPFQYRKAHIWTCSNAERIGDYDYEYWKDEGYGKMIIQGDPRNGAFSCEWSNANRIMFRSGKKYGSHVTTHSQMGNISLSFAAEYQSGIYVLCVYGWSVAPLTEWNIVEDYSSHKPMSHQDYLATVTIDGGIYEIYRTTRVDHPSILGVKTFEQYWSVRTNRRSSGVVDVSAHFRVWESHGMKLGSISEIALCIESWQGGGSAEVTKNELLVGNCIEE